MKTDHKIHTIEKRNTKNSHFFYTNNPLRTTYIKKKLNFANIKIRALISS